MGRGGPGRPALVLSADWSLSWVQGSCGPKPAVKLSCSISPTGRLGALHPSGSLRGSWRPHVVRGCYGFGGQVTQSPPWCWCHDNSLGGHRPQAHPIRAPDGLHGHPGACGPADGVGARWGPACGPRGSVRSAGEGGGGPEAWQVHGGNRAGGQSLGERMLIPRRHPCGSGSADGVQQGDSGSCSQVKRVSQPPTPPGSWVKEA